MKVTIKAKGKTTAILTDEDECMNLGNGSPVAYFYRTVKKGKKIKIGFMKPNADTQVTYTTSNKKVASVTKNGTIKGVKKGKAKITAKAVQNGKTFYARLIVTVKK